MIVKYHKKLQKPTYSLSSGYITYQTVLNNCVSFAY